MEDDLRTKHADILKDPNGPLNHYNVIYPDDPRTENYFDFCGNTIYRAYNVLSLEDREALLEEIDDELSRNPNWDLSVEATKELSTRKLKNKECWVNFFKMVKHHLYNYAKITKNPRIMDLKIQSYWAKRLRDISEEKYAEELYINYGNTHSHQHFDLGLIFYLQNPSRIYGTLIENNGREVIIPGDENSLILHHSAVNHQPAHPPPIVAKDYYRCVIVADFMYPDKDKKMRIADDRKR